jgi:hypothetical protein
MTDKRQPEPSNRELIDGAVRKIVTALVIAGGVIALGIYSRPGPPRYQAFAAEGQIVRIDMRSGTVIACEGNQCMTVVRRGQRLRRSLPGAAPKQETHPAPVLPAPAQPQKALPAPTPKAGSTRP